MDYKDSVFYEKIVELKNQKQIPETVLNDNLLIIEEFLEKQTKCKSGPMKLCKQMLPGWEERLAYENGSIYIRFNHCAHWIHDNEFHLLEQNFLYANYQVLDFTNTFENYIEEHKDLTDADKRKIYGNLIGMTKKILADNNSWKGIYLTGKFGVGKTYFLKCVANSFALQNKKVVFLTPNELIKKAKEGISKTDSTEYLQLEKKCLQADVLFFDDIGAETVTEWSRDELLFAILNYRMEYEKTTFFSSNKTIATLEENYINKKIIGYHRKDEYLKAARFVERIKALTLETTLNGKNHRY